MSEWKEYKLGEIATRIGDGLHGTPQYDENGEYYFINGNNIANGKVVIKNETRRVSTEEYEKYLKPLANNTILLSINGTIGNIGLYNGEKCMLGKSACYINLKEGVNRNFVYYNFVNKDFQEFLQGIATGTTIPNVPLKGLREYDIKLPSSEEQERIAGILSSLDNKIDLLTRQNCTLEAMAETLFSQYFNEKENDDTIEQLICIQNGYAFKSQDFKEMGTNGVVKIKNISGGVINIDTTDYIDSQIADVIHPKFRISSGDILIAMTGAEIGKLGIIPSTDKSLWLNQRGRRGARINRPHSSD